MSEPRHQKLTAMGISNLLATGRFEVLDRLALEICNMWLSVFGEIKEALSQESEECVIRTLASRALAHLYLFTLSSVLKLYWDRVPTTFWKNSEGTVEYQRREAVRS